MIIFVSSYQESRGILFLISGARQFSWAEGRA
jgi:hypothetical protein